MEEIYKYNRNEMEERLPSYIFGELSGNEKEIFEASLSDFPDIQDEIKQVRLTFEMLDKIDYDKVLFDKTKDLPTRVARQVAKSNESKKRSFLPIRFLVPALITAGLLFVAVKTGFLDNYWKDANPKTTNTISKNDKIETAVQDILADEEVQNEISNSNDLAINQIDVIDDNDLVDNIEQYYDNFIFNINTYFNTANSPGIETYLTINNHIENIDEEIFEEIMEDIKNANF